MQIALCTTGLRPPRALALLRDFTPHVRFFVAGDQRSDHEGIATFLSTLGNAVYLHPDDQAVWSCSSLIGWNCIQRRNIAFLEALKWGAGLIVSWDDDNLPLASSCFHAFSSPLSGWSGLRAVDDWLDIGSLLIPPVRQRGIPLAHRPGTWYEHGTNFKIGVVQGVALGDPDVDAVERIAKAPLVHSVSELLRDGVAFVPEAGGWTVFNTQNTAFIRELAPAMFCPPGVGRHDDIVASLICQRVMRERGYAVRFGPPLAWQQRNAHDLRRDLREEQWGYEHIEPLAHWLDGLRLDGAEDGCLSMLFDIWASLAGTSLVPGQVCAIAQSWLIDCERAMQ